MASGVITVLSNASSRKFDVESASCFHTIKAIYQVRPTNQIAAVCSDDPVVVGSTLTFNYVTQPTVVSYTVTDTTATPASSLTDNGLLVVVLVVCALLFSGFSGYRAGYTS